MKLSHIFEQYQLKKNNENRQNDEESIIDMIVTDDCKNENDDKKIKFDKKQIPFLCSKYK